MENYTIPNPRTDFAEIKFPMEYFKNIPRNEYGEIKYAWIREVIQNAIDARSKNIHIRVNDGYIKVVDDGIGMDYDTLVNAFLTLGGSKKEEGNVGGFGKAKEIELFTWDEWSIKTSTGKEAWFVSDKHIGQKPITKIDSIHFKGTIITIKSDDNISDYNWNTTIRRYVKTCTTNCNIYLNGEKIETMSMRGKKIYLDWAEITYNKSRDSGEIYVRNGKITMFETYHYNLKGTVIIDLLKPSTEILTSNRESFKSEYRHKYDKLMEEITIDTKSAFKEKPSMVLETFNGENIVEYVKNNIDISLMDEETKACFEEAKDVDDLLKLKENITNHVLAESIHSTIVEMQESKYVSVSKMGFEFFVMRLENKDPSIDPNSRKCQTILNFTKNILVRMMEEYKIKEDIKVGLLFPSKDDSDVNARYLKQDGNQYILINPNSIITMRDHVALGVQLFNYVSHELTHRHYSYHNEDFTSLWTTYLECYPRYVREWHDIFKRSKMEVKQAFH